MEKCFLKFFDVVKTYWNTVKYQNLGGGGGGGGVENVSSISPPWSSVILKDD